MAKPTIDPNKGMPVVGLKDLVYILVCRRQGGIDSFSVITNNNLARPIETLSLGLEVPCRDAENAIVIGFSQIQCLVTEALEDVQQMATIRARINQNSVFAHDHPSTSNAANERLLPFDPEADELSSEVLFNFDLNEFEAAEKRLAHILAQPKTPIFWNMDDSRGIFRRMGTTPGVLIAFSIFITLLIFLYILDYYWPAYGILNRVFFL